MGEIVGAGVPGGGRWPVSERHHRSTITSVRAVQYTHTAHPRWTGVHVSETYLLV